MLTIGPIVIVLLFILAFILWIKFLSKDKPIRVIREEQLYNRNKGKEELVKKDQREAIKREERIEIRKKEEEDKDRE